MNPDMNEMMFLVLAGAICHQRDILVETQGLRDLRVHLLVIQPSRTGKGVSLGILANAATLCGVSNTNEIVFTDAGLIGRINEKIVAQNKDLKPDDEDYIDPTVIGDLGNFEIISFSEGKQMIKLSAYAEDKLELLQSAMDTPGKIRKKLAEGVSIEYESNASIVATTYFLDDFEKIFLEQGIFQRMLVYVRNFTIKERRQLNNEIIFADRIKNDNFQDDLKEYCDELITKVQRTPEGTRLTIDKTAQKYINEKINTWTNSIEADFKGAELEIMLSYTTASINLFYKIAGIAAVLNGSKKITSREANFAHGFVRKYIQSIQNEVLAKVSVVDDRMIGAYISKFIQTVEKKDKSGEPIDGPTKEEIETALKVKFHDITKPRITKVLRDMVGTQELRFLNPTASDKKYIRIEK